MKKIIVVKDMPWGKKGDIVPLDEGGHWNDKEVGFSIYTQRQVKQLILDGWVKEFVEEENLKKDIKELCLQTFMITNHEKKFVDEVTNSFFYLFRTKFDEAYERWKDDGKEKFYTMGFIRKELFEKEGDK